MASTRKRNRPNAKYHKGKRNRLEYQPLITQLRAEQAGHCAICHEQKPLGIDHDHKTGSIRALLCRDCNIGLGCLKDSVAILRAAITYLEHYEQYPRPLIEPVSSWTSERRLAFGDTMKARPQMKGTAHPMHKRRMARLWAATLAREAQP